MTSQQPGPLPITSNRGNGSLSTSPHHPPKSHTRFFVVSMPRMRTVCQDKASQSFIWESEISSLQILLIPPASVTPLFIKCLINQT